MRTPVEIVAERIHPVRVGQGQFPSWFAISFRGRMLTCQSASLFYGNAIIQWRDFSSRKERNKVTHHRQSIGSNIFIGKPATNCRTLQNGSHMTDCPKVLVKVNDMILQLNQKATHTIKTITFPCTPGTLVLNTFFAICDSSCFVAQFQA